MAMRIDTVPQRHEMAAVKAGKEPELTMARCDNMFCGVALELPILALQAMAIVPRGSKRGSLVAIAPYHGPDRHYEIHGLLCETCLERIYSGDEIHFGDDILVRPK